MIIRALALAVSLLVVAACAPSTPTAGPASPAASSATVNPSAAFCAAFVARGEALVALDELPEGATAEQYKAAAEAAGIALAALVAASAGFPQFGAQLDELNGPTRGIVDAINALAPDASPEDIQAALEPFQLATLIQDAAALRETICTSASAPSVAS